MPAELPLVPSAGALAISALLFFLPVGGPMAHRAGTLFRVAAALVARGVVGILTVLARFAVAPAPATARAAAYLSGGLEAWILAALLVSRNGSPTFVLDDLLPSAVSEGAILAATLGALLFA